MARHLFAALLTFALALPAFAEDPPDAAVAEATPLPGGLQPDLRGELALSLTDAIAMGIENNLDVEIVRHDPMIAEQDHRIARGAHDPNLYGTFDYASRETPIASALQAGGRLVERETTGSGGLRGLLPKLGWTYDLGFTGRRITTTSSISELSPEYNSGITGSVTMPILKGFLWGQAWTQVKISGLGSEIAQEEFRQQLMDVVRGIENAYWDLAAQKENRAVANKSLETSRALLGQTNAQYEVGVVSRVEVTESEAGVADREFRQIGADNRYLTAQDDLIDAVLGPYLSPTSSLKIIPTDKPEEYTTFELDREESARKAFEKRPELEIARRQLEQTRISLKFARNQRLPQLDLVGSYGYQGLAGATNPAEPIFGGVTQPQVVTEPIPVSPLGGGAPIAVANRTTVEQVPVLNAQGERVRQPTAASRTFSSADDDYFSADGAKQWTGGARLTIPLGNRAGRGGVDKAHLELRKARTFLRRLEQQIVIDVRKSVRDLRSAQLGIEAAERRRVAAQEQHRAEQIRLEHGESTPFDVLQREEDLVEAESQKIGALQIYHSSVASLDRAQGTILEDRGVIVEEARPLR
ncbi:MAG: TolC family protein [bacterium]|nr:TolC family protein [bacterium]